MYLNPLASLFQFQMWLPDDAKGEQQAQGSGSSATGLRKSSIFLISSGAGSEEKVRAVCVGHKGACTEC